MRKRMGAIIALTIIVSWGLVSAVTFSPAHGQALSGDRSVKPCVREGKAKRGFSVARAKVFQRLGLTVEQQEEMKELRRQFRDDLQRLRRGHRESLLNVLDEEQRQKLEEKRGENDRFLRERIPPGERGYDPQPDVGFKEDQEPADSWESFMVEVDSNNNGVLDEEDFEAAQARGDEDLPPSWVSAAQEFDANGDGVIDQREYRQVFKSYQEESSAVRPEPQKEDIIAGQTSENFKGTGVSVNTWGIIKRSFRE